MNILRFAKAHQPNQALSGGTPISLHFGSPGALIQPLRAFRRAVSFGLFAVGCRVAGVLRQSVRLFVRSRGLLVHISEAWGSPEGLLDSSGGLLGPILEAMDVSWVAFWEVLGSICLRFGRPGPSGGASWGSARPSWGLLGRFRTSKPQFWSILDQFGAILEPLWSHFGRPGPHFGRSDLHFGVPGAPFGRLRHDFAPPSL